MGMDARSKTGDGRPNPSQKAAETDWKRAVLGRLLSGILVNIEPVLAFTPRAGIHPLIIAVDDDPLLLLVRSDFEHGLSSLAFGQRTIRC